MSIAVILLILALVCFFVAAIASINTLVAPRVNLIALGLFFWVLSVLVGGAVRVHG